MSAPPDPTEPDFAHEIPSPAPRRPRLSTVRQRLQGPLLGCALVGLSMAGWRFLQVWNARQPPDGNVALAALQPAASSFDLRNAIIPRETIRSGGPPKDGIPSLTKPTIVTADQANFLQPEDRVIGAAVGESARAYPLRILNYHEAVNDRVGDVPLVVTYCPRCDSAAVFDRRVGDDVLEFGISGLLYNSNVLLYDRGRPGRESLWSQMMAKAVSGPRVGQQLKSLPFELTTWADWSRRRPETLVLSTETGHRRDYARSPYGDYFRSPRLMFPAEPLSNRLPLKARVLGVWTDKSARAYPLAAFDQLNQATELKQEIDSRQSTLVYDPAAKTLRVTKADDGVRWTYSLWFAWYAFHPKTELYEP